MAQPANPSSADKLSSLLSRLNPVPGFAEYTGPYKVGTVDVEIPVSELDSPAPAPASAIEAGIETVQFRIFYPTTPDAQGKRITWLPAPQRDHLSAYIQFLGVGTLVAHAVSFLPRHLHYTSIPVIKNAPLLEPNTSNHRWPTAIFSHGLGGSRNAYSQIVGSLASHGVVVICPEHRDGSSVVSFIRIPSEQNRYFVRSTRRVIPYNRIPHDATDAVHALRNEQLRIRLWELGLVHQAVLAIDRGGPSSPLTNLNRSTPEPALAQFRDRLHVREPGSVIFMGHSFGSASVAQFLKSVFYAGRPELEDMAEPLYVPKPGSAICKQVTPRNVTILLDMWCFPLLAKSTKALFDLPLPVYADAHTTIPSSPPSSSPANTPPAATTTPPGGSALLAIESSDFHAWREHLHATARALSPRPSAPRVSADAFYDASGVRLPEPHVFYVERSAHLSQSDFGVLFPWLTRKVFGSEHPERALRLNLRAALQVLRVNGVPVARTWEGDLLEGGAGGLVGKLDVGGEGEGEEGVDGDRGNDGVDGGVGDVDGILDDPAILDRSGSGAVEAWKFIDIVGMGVVEDAEGKAGTGDAAAETQEQEQGMAGAIDPAEDVATVKAMKAATSSA
ncbi:phospholipase A2 [Whalleya microplaca]|nr:phospholipase A2 [Whalleya microplaca]